MQKFQGLLFVLKQSYICNFTICMTVPLIENLRKHIPNNVELLDRVYVLLGYWEYFRWNVLPSFFDLWVFGHYLQWPHYFVEVFYVYTDPMKRSWNNNGSFFNEKVHLGFRNMLLNVSLQLKILSWNNMPASTTKLVNNFAKTLSKLMTRPPKDLICILCKT